MKLKYFVIGLALSVVANVPTKASAVPLYPTGIDNNQTVRLQMERNAPNGAPVTINITPQYGMKNGGFPNTWIGLDKDSSFKYLTNGSGVNLQSSNGNYSLNVGTLNGTIGTPLSTYQSAFARYQDWNLEKVGGSYNDTYLIHWRTDINTNLCLDIRGFGQGQQLNNQIPILSNCDRNNLNQRIRVIKQSSVPTQAALNQDIKIQLTFSGNFTQSQKNAIQKAAQNWENIITNDMVPDGILNILVTEGDKMAASGIHWAETDSPSNAPGQMPRTRSNLVGQYHTRMHFRRAFLNGPSSYQLTTLATHEIGHALYLDEASNDSWLGTDGIMNIYPLRQKVTEGVYRRLEQMGYRVNRNPALNW
jgi:predicted Zn-dependent protease